MFFFLLSLYTNLSFWRLAYWGDFLVLSYVQLPPPPSEVTEWVGCNLLTSLFFPRTVLFIILFILLPKSALHSITVFFSLLPNSDFKVSCHAGCCTFFPFSTSGSLHSFHLTYVLPYLFSLISLSYQAPYTVKGFQQNIMTLITFLSAVFTQSDYIFVVNLDWLILFL